MLSKEDDPFWKAAEELQIPVSMHFGLVTTDVTTRPFPRRPGRSARSTA